MAIAFSSSGDAVMTREIACSCSSYWSFTDTASEFDVMSTAEWINEHQFRKVCSLRNDVIRTKYFIFSQ